MSPNFVMPVVRFLGAADQLLRGFQGLPFGSGTSTDAVVRLQAVREAASQLQGSGYLSPRLLAKLDEVGDAEAPQVVAHLEAALHGVLRREIQTVGEEGVVSITGGAKDPFWRGGITPGMPERPDVLDVALGRKPLMTGPLRRYFVEGTLDLTSLSGDSLYQAHLLSLRMAQVVGAPWVSPMKRGALKTFSDSLPTPSATIYRTFWRLVAAHVMEEGLDDMGRRQRLEALSRWGTQEEMVERVEELVVAIDEAKSLKEIIQVVKKSRLPFADHCRQRLLELLKGASRETIADITPDFGIQRKVAALFGVSVGEMELSEGVVQIIPDQDAEDRAGAAEQRATAAEARVAAAEAELARLQSEPPPIEVALVAELRQKLGGDVVGTVDRLLANQKADQQALAGLRAECDARFTRTQVDAEVAAAKRGLFTRAQVDAEVAAARAAAERERDAARAERDARPMQTQLDDALRRATKAEADKGAAEQKVAAAEAAKATAEARVKELEKRAEITPQALEGLRRQLEEVQATLSGRGEITVAELADLRAKLEAFGEETPEGIRALREEVANLQRELGEQRGRAELAERERDTAETAKESAEEAARRSAAAFAVLQAAFDATPGARVTGAPVTAPPEQPAARAPEPEPAHPPRRAEPPPQPEPAPPRRGRPRPTEPTVASGEHSQFFVVSAITPKTKSGTRPGEANARMRHANGRDSFKYGDRIVTSGEGRVDLCPGAVAEFGSHHFVTLFDPDANEYSFPSVEDVVYGSELLNANRAVTSGTGKPWRTAARFSTFFIPESTNVSVSGDNIQLAVELRGGVSVKLLREAAETPVRGVTDTVTSIDLQVGDALVINHTGTLRTYWVKKTPKGAIIIDARPPHVLI